MIEPPFPDPPRLGPLPAPREDELVAAYARLCDEALVLSRAAELLGIDVARAEALVRSGELLAIPGPWPMRQAYRSGLGCFVPAWQLAGGRPVPGLRAVLDAAAAAGLTSLGLDRLMSARLASAGGSSPAALLREGEIERVVALLGGETRRAPASPRSARRRGRPRSLHRPHLRRHTLAA